MIEFERMEFLSVIAAVSCIVSPILFVFCAWLGFMYFKARAAADNARKRYENKISIISRTAQNAVREVWFEEVKNAHFFGNELEVELKLVYPMMRYLGYTPDELKMRVNVDIRVGRQNVTGIADWVVYRGGKPVMVIEAKEKGQGLSVAVQEQARSYCFALNCPSYLLTNGRLIQVYKRGLDSDLLMFQCEVVELSDKWPKLYEMIGVPD